MKKLGQFFGSEIETPNEMQWRKFLQWPNPLQQPYICYAKRAYFQFLKSATHQ